MASAERQPDRAGHVTRIRDTAAQDVAREPAPKRRWPWVAGGLMAIAAFAFAWPAVSRWSGSEISVPRDRVRIAEVSRATFEREIAVRGTVVAAVSPTLYAPDAGIVKLHVDAGDLVAEQDALATIESPELENRLALQRSTLESMNTELRRRQIERRRQELSSRQAEDLARVAVVAAERELRRAEAAWAERVIKRQDLDKARDDLEAARLNYEHARDTAALERDSLAFESRAAGQARDRQELTVADIERQLDALQIRSPVTGMVGNIAVQERQAVTSNMALLSVVDLSAYEIEMLVPESYADDLNLGLPAVVEVAGVEQPGRVTAVSPEVQDGQVRGRIRFDGDPPRGLRQNQRVSARIQLETRAAALVVRRGPFFDDGGGRVAYRVAGDVLQRIPIQTGAVSVDQVEILAGLVQGDRIVVSSHEPFRNAGTVLLTQ